MKFIFRGDAEEFAALMVAISDITRMARQPDIPQSTSSKRRVWGGKSKGWVEKVD